MRKIARTFFVFMQFVTMCLYSNAQTNANSFKFEFGIGPSISGIRMPNFRLLPVEHSIAYYGVKNVGFKGIRPCLYASVSRGLTKSIFLVTSFQKSTTVFKYYPIILSLADSTLYDNEQYRPTEKTRILFPYAQMNIGFGFRKKVERFSLSLIFEYGMRKYDKQQIAVERWYNAYRSDPFVLHESFRSEFNVNSMKLSSVYSVGLSAAFELNSSFSVIANATFQFVPKVPISGSYHIWNDKIHISAYQQFIVHGNSMNCTFGLAYNFGS